jgi:hypothetical protein
MTEGKKTVLYEVINPSDPVTFKAASLAAAFIAVTVVGGGQYAARPIDDPEAVEVPLFLFGGSEQWVAKNLPGEDIEGIVDRHMDDTIAALQSFCTGSARDRALFDSAREAITDPARLAAFDAEWDDKKRSSINDIANRAHTIAGRLAAKQEEAA